MTVSPHRPPARGDGFPHRHHRAHAQEKAQPHCGLAVEQPIGNSVGGHGGLLSLMPPANKLTPLAARTSRAAPSRQTSGANAPASAGSGRAGPVRTPRPTAGLGAAHQATGIAPRSAACNARSSDGDGRRAVLPRLERRAENPLARGERHVPRPRHAHRRPRPRAGGDHRRRPAPARRHGPRYRVVSHLRPFPGKAVDSMAHPAFVGDRIHLRSPKELACLRLGD